MGGGESAVVEVPFKVSEDAEGAEGFTIRVTNELGESERREVEVDIGGSAGSGTGGVTGFASFLGEGNGMIWVIGLVNLVLIILIIIVAVRVSKR